MLCSGLAYNYGMAVSLYIQGADYNKAGETEKARTMGNMAFIHDIVVVIIHVVLYSLGIISSIVAVAVVYSRGAKFVDDVVNDLNN